MQKVFTKTFMKTNCGCYREQGRLMECSFMQAKEITLELILLSEIPLRDKFWFVCNVLASDNQAKEIAISVAEIVLPIFEKNNPGDMRIRECIEAAKNFKNKKITISKLNTKRAAAYAAYADAGGAADAAAAAAFDAAAAAAFDAAAAAAAAVAAAAAAYGAAAAENYTEQLLQFLITFCANN